MWAELSTHAIFLVFVAGAVYAQALTGFALALILLGLIGATNLVPLPDAVNAVTIIALSSAWTFLYRRRALHIQRVIVPTVVASAVGIVVGALVLTWLAETAYQSLRLLLGVSIVACALSLWRAVQPLPSLSSPTIFALTGGLAGLLAGMFSAPGPPLVYLLYRQPMSLVRIQNALMVIFGLGTALPDHRRAIRPVLVALPATGGRGSSSRVCRDILCGAAAAALVTQAAQGAHLRAADRRRAEHGHQRIDRDASVSSTARSNLGRACGRSARSPRI